MDLSGFCPHYHQAVQLVGRRWTGSILRAIMAGRHRYAEIRSTIPGVSDTMLAQRLNEMEREGLVDRRVIPESPVRVEYHLTEKGQALLPAVRALAAWADTWLGPKENGD